jgi:hypothetical protein
MSELLDKARRFNLLLMERENRHTVGIRQLAMADDALFCELCSLKIEIDFAFKQKALAEGA